MTPNARVALSAVGLVAFMGAMSFAAVPFYDWFCRVTGFGGTTSVSDGTGIEPTDQTVIVRFEAFTERGMPWQFRPVQRSMTVRIGETNLAFYEAHNPTDRPVAGQASFNVVPYAAGGYFSKIQCFCFTEQVLQPGETVQMPVSFYVDPAILDDPDGRGVREITLGYTFYEIDLPPEQAQAALARPVAEVPEGL
ncbi:Cytochrome oxidase assembly factor [Rubellimicrobium thermophilum DSM 16684]|uniref:Cytochrome c oxidase assembly protein CtaG n=1 Tax=Rubellimicrobium thermophilum DSM 16684 TaxID=1123069 RepID=S9SB79_9RHOB|nr:cytochrome c oxidase assembly protein [Rubellimicrobium thermophilum]EPX87385.1 Cytochrome oxidase assembly factor [Rubellimicrobium thermophilum DSM 16684]